MKSKVKNFIKEYIIAMSAVILFAAFLYTFFSIEKKIIILTAEPWVDPVRNVIMINFDGDVHEYEYYEEEREEIA